MINSTERDLFFTEQMGECWHEPEKYDCWTSSGTYEFTRCSKCKTDWRDIKGFNNFSTWEGFGKLYKWAEQQLWFEDLLYRYWSCPVNRNVFPYHFIDPNRFADSLYEFLTGAGHSMYLQWKEKGRYNV